METKRLCFADLPILRRKEMKKPFLGALFIMLLVMLFVGNPVRAEDVKSGSDPKTQNQLSQEEGVCLKDLLTRVRNINAISESEASAIKAVISSGRYNVCSLAGFLKENY
jgi:hypothetical protein